MRCCTCVVVSQAWIPSVFLHSFFFMYALILFFHAASTRKSAPLSPLRVQVDGRKIVLLVGLFTCRGSHGVSGRVLGTGYKPL